MLSSRRSSLNLIHPQIVDDALFRLRNAQHIVDIGFEQSKLLPYRTPCPGVLMCNFSQIYPMDRGTNYAVRDGNEMAKHILRSLEEDTIFPKSYKQPKPAEAAVA